MEATPAGRKCYGMALSGGADKGSWEAGVVSGLVKRLPAPERRWEIVTGVSAGSVVASAMGLYAVGDEVNMSNFIIDTMLNFTKDGVYRDWPGGVALARGLFDSSPLYDSISHLMAPGMRDRRVIIAAASTTTGEVKRFDSQSDSRAFSPTSWAQAVRASCSIPVAFAPTRIGNDTFFDCGSQIGVDIDSVVSHCREEGVADSDIVVDIVDSYKNTAYSSGVTQNKVAVALVQHRVSLHMADSSSHDSSMNHIKDAIAAYPDVVFRFLIQPSKVLPGDGMHFDGAEMVEMRTIGEHDSATATSRSTDGLR
eukprot:gnl/TRDRNA2_/TRDRNA2_180775_c0_seq1.p1 gnl/TRDRNA2_/TRDRNA2_180775_c0~~gnl/TRDRNA2_/TRDRNA2_180775_c0_seq1.p1  ORF type:complete len:326 (-),score=41.74 gnl/TRDRNA2_/TRDRNA2_180775_c0_seq1:21-950(-)